MWKFYKRLLEVSMAQQKNHFVLQTIILVVIGFVMCAGGFTYWAVWKTLPRFSKLETHKSSFAKEKAPNNEITVATFNIAYGQGIKVKPTDWRDEDTTRARLKDLAKVMKKMDADIVLLQEIDTESHRTQYINQTDILLKESGYPYYACALVWDKNYIPFPFWPPQDHLGKVQSNNCIFSKYPLKSHERLVLEKPATYPWWYNLGYIDRAAQRVVAIIGEKEVNLVNVHLEAWERKTRESQVQDVINWLDELKGPVIMGGDFNSIPAESTKKDDFKDDPGYDYFNDNTISIVKKGLGKFTQAIPTEKFVKNESENMTFRGDVANRKLDYIFGFNGAQVLSGRVVKESGVASDHYPVIASVKLK